MKKELQIPKKKKERIKVNPTDEKKLISLQKLIDRGEYRVDSGKLAEKIVEQHLKNGNS